MADECPPCEAGLPPWLATFADLMSLLMCFFVLLLSFAELDAIRFQKMAESMKDAFGVQREIPAQEIVKGVSVIKQEWSPTTGEPSVIAEIKQETSDTEEEYAELQQEASDMEREYVELKEQAEEAAQDAQDTAREAERVQKELEQQAEELQDALEEEIDEGMISVEQEEGKIIIRVREKGSFPSGSARLDEGFYEVMDRITAVLKDKPGEIIVSGHTDNIPIKTGRFRSNWELSAARAVTVLHAMLRNKDIDPDRVQVQGHAETQPMDTNATSEGRTRNRRVELVITRGHGEEFQDMEELLAPPQGNLNDSL